MLVRYLYLILFVSALSGAVGGCASVSVTATLDLPAEVPVQTFPYIAIIRANDPEGEFAQLRIFEHLSAGESSVEIYDEEELHERVAAGSLGTPVVVLATRLRIEEGFEDRWGHLSGRPPLQGVTMPVRRSPTGDWAVVEGRLRVVVSDAETGRRFQEHEVQAREEGGDFELMRRIVLERLATNLAVAMTRREGNIQVELMRVDMGGHADAVAAARRGDWAEARRLWARLVRASREGTLSREERAALLYNLATSLRFSHPSSPEAIDAAERAIRRALSLDDEPRYLRALDDLERHRDRVVQIERQRAARLRNFGLRRSSSPRVVPPPLPPAYLRDSSPERR